jgi:hypothetical protein
MVEYSLKIPVVPSKQDRKLYGCNKFTMHDIWEVIKKMDALAETCVLARESFRNTNLDSKRQ